MAYAMGKGVGGRELGEWRAGEVGEWGEGVAGCPCRGIVVRSYGCEGGRQGGGKKGWEWKGM